MGLSKCTMQHEVSLTVPERHLHQRHHCVADRGLRLHLAAYPATVEVAEGGLAAALSLPVGHCSLSYTGQPVRYTSI